MITLYTTLRIFFLTISDQVELFLYLNYYKIFYQKKKKKLLQDMINHISHMYVVNVITHMARSCLRVGYLLLAAYEHNAPRPPLWSIRDLNSH